MMGILARRTLSDCLLFTLEIFLGLLIVGLPGLVIQRLVVFCIPYKYIPHLIFYIIPECLQFLLPASLMGGVIITFARMGAENEIVVLKSSGIQPTRLIYPLLAMSFIISFGAWYINDIAASCRERGIQNVSLNGAEDIVKGILKSKGEINSRDMRIKVDSVEGNCLHGVSFYYKESPEALPIDIETQTAEVQTDLEHKQFIVLFTNGKGRYEDDDGGFDSLCIPIPISLFLQDSASDITNATMGQMIKEFEELNDSIKKTKERIASDAATILLTGDFDLYKSESLKECHSNLKRYNNIYQKAAIEPYRRFTMGFACFCLVAFSAPMAIYYNKKNIYSNIVRCAATAVFLFIFLFAMGLNFGKQGVIPPWMICFADIVPLVIGLFLMQYVSNKDAPS